MREDGDFNCATSPNCAELQQPCRFSRGCLLSALADGGDCGDRPAMKPTSRYAIRSARILVAICCLSAAQVPGRALGTQSQSRPSNAAGQPEPRPPSPAAPVPPGRDLVAGLAAGESYVIVTRRDLFPRVSEGADEWFAITGRFVPADGTWTSRATGFPTPGTPWHSCPAETQCGGIHERGLVLDRWYRPQQHEAVALGVKLSFDDGGRLFHEGRQIGTISLASFAPSQMQRQINPAASPAVPAWSDLERRWGPLIRLAGFEWTGTDGKTRSWRLDPTQRILRIVARVGGREQEEGVMTSLHERNVQVSLPTSTGGEETYMLQLQDDGSYLIFLPGMLPGMQPFTRRTYDFAPRAYRVIERPVRDSSAAPRVVESGTLRGSQRRP
jgi:hypothetical protein